MNDAAIKKPSYRAYSVKGEGENAKWLELGAAWPHGDGEGHDVVLDIVPIGGFTGVSSCFYGRIVLRKISPKASKPARDIRKTVFKKLR